MPLIRNSSDKIAGSGILSHEVTLTYERQSGDINVQESVIWYILP